MNKHNMQNFYYKIKDTKQTLIMTLYKFESSSLKTRCKIINQQKSKELLSLESEDYHFKSLVCCKHALKFHSTKYFKKSITPKIPKRKN